MRYFLLTVALFTVWHCKTDMWWQRRWLFTKMSKKPMRNKNDALQTLDINTTWTHIALNAHTWRIFYCLVHLSIMEIRRTLRKKWSIHPVLPVILVFAVCLVSITAQCWRYCLAENFAEFNCCISKHFPRIKLQMWIPASHCIRVTRAGGRALSDHSSSFPWIACSCSKQKEDARSNYLWP